jgi:hypothetical protein
MSGEFLASAKDEELMLAALGKVRRPVRGQCACAFSEVLPLSPPLLLGRAGRRSLWPRYLSAACSQWMAWLSPAAGTT